MAMSPSERRTVKQALEALLEHINQVAEKAREVGDEGPGVDWSLIEDTRINALDAIRRIG